jgi:hypothetical protein
MEIALRIAELLLNFRLPLGEGVGDVFEEDQAEDGVLVNGGVEVRPQLVGGGPELLVELAEEGLGGGVGHCWVKAEKLKGREVGMDFVARQANGQGRDLQRKGKLNERVAGRSDSGSLSAEMVRTREPKLRRMESLAAKRREEGRKKRSLWGP